VPSKFSGYIIILTEYFDKYSVTVRKMVHNKGNIDAYAKINFYTVSFWPFLM